MHDLAGDTDRAIALLERARDEVSSGVERAEALVRLADVQDDPAGDGPLYREALAEAAGDDALTATIHTSLALLDGLGRGRGAGVAHAELAVRAASRTDDPEIRCRALAAYGDWNFRAGRGIQHAEMDGDDPRAVAALVAARPGADRSVLPPAGPGCGSRKCERRCCTSSTRRTRHGTTPTVPRPTPGG